MGQQPVTFRTVSRKTDDDDVVNPRRSERVVQALANGGGSGIAVYE